VAPPKNLKNWHAYTHIQDPHPFPFPLSHSRRQFPEGKGRTLGAAGEAQGAVQRIPDPHQVRAPQLYGHGEVRIWVI